MSEIITDETKVFLASHPVDMRKSINGLAAIVEGSFDLDLYEDCLFMFCSKDHAKIKALKWDADGFVLYYKRRERGTFQWPKNFRNDDTDQIPRSDLNRLLSGLIMESYIKRRHFVTV